MNEVQRQRYWNCTSDACIDVLHPDIPAICSNIKTIFPGIWVRPSYINNGYPYTGKTASLSWKHILSTMYTNINLKYACQLNAWLQTHPSYFYRSPRPLSRPLLLLFTGEFSIFAQMSTEYFHRVDTMMSRGLEVHDCRLICLLLGFNSVLHQNIYPANLQTLATLCIKPKWKSRQNNRQSYGYE